jgi:hypothetical protein
VAEPQPPVQIDNQLYTQEPSGYFRCSVDLPGEPGHTVFFRGTICSSGRLFPVYRLSHLHCTGLVCIPSSIEIIQPWQRIFSDEPKGVTAVAFEYNSKVRELDPSSFRGTGIRFLCLPASLESFTGRYPPFPTSLLALAFDRGCRLRRIDQALVFDPTILHICLPASLQYIDTLQLFRVEWRSARLPSLPFWTVEAGSRHFVMVGSTLMNFARTSVVHSFDRNGVGAFDSKVQELCPRAFESHRMATFNCPASSSLRFIRTLAFRHCDSLTSITIAASVELIEELAFDDCRGLRDVRIAAGSRLEQIEKDAFRSCNRLEAVDVPAATKVRARFELVATVVGEDASKRIRVRFITREETTHRFPFGKPAVLNWSEKLIPPKFPTF